MTMIIKKKNMIIGQKLQFIMILNKPIIGEDMIKINIGIMMMIRNRRDLIGKTTNQDLNLQGKKLIMLKKNKNQI